jgi:hypothetical protein
MLDQLLNQPTVAEVASPFADNLRIYINSPFQILVKNLDKIDDFICLVHLEVFNRLLHQMWHISRQPVIIDGLKDTSEAVHCSQAKLLMVVGDDRLQKGIIAGI